MVYEFLYNLCVTAGPDKHQPAPRVGHRDQFPQIGGSSVKFPKLQNGRGHVDMRKKNPRPCIRNQCSVVVCCRPLVIPPRNCCR